MKALNFFYKKVEKFAVILVLTFFSTIVYAQPSDPQTDPDNPVPIPGIAYLLLGGLIIGIKKIIGHHKQRSH